MESPLVRQKIKADMAEGDIRNSDSGCTKKKGGI